MAVPIRSSRFPKQSWRSSVAWLALPAIALLSGCFGPPEFPEELDVVLPNDAVRTTPIDTGPESVADGVWEAFRKAPVEGAESSDDEPGPYGGLLNGGILERPEPETVMFQSHFDEAGRMTLVTENAFYLPEFFGETFVIDKEFHPGATAGLSYAAASYGVTVEDEVGIAVFVQVRALGLPIGDAVVYAWGTQVENRIDGTFGYLADLGGLARLIVGSGGDQYPVYITKAE